MDSLRNTREPSPQEDRSKLSAAKKTVAKFISKFISKGPPTQKLTEAQLTSAIGAGAFRIVDKNAPESRGLSKDLTQWGYIKAGRDEQGNDVFIRRDVIKAKLGFSDEQLKQKKTINKITESIHLTAKNKQEQSSKALEEQGLAHSEIDRHIIASTATTPTEQIHASKFLQTIGFSENDINQHIVNGTLQTTVEANHQNITTIFATEINLLKDKGVTDAEIDDAISKGTFTGIITQLDRAEKKEANTTKNLQTLQEQIYMRRNGAPEELIANYNTPAFKKMLNETINWEQGQVQGDLNYAKTKGIPPAQIRQATLEGTLQQTIFAEEIEYLQSHGLTDNQVDQLIQNRTLGQDYIDYVEDIASRDIYALLSQGVPDEDIRDAIVKGTYPNLVEEHLSDQIELLRNSGATDEGIHELIANGKLNDWANWANVRVPYEQLINALPGLDPDTTRNTIINAMSRIGSVAAGIAVELETENNDVVHTFVYINPKGQAKIKLWGGNPLPQEGSDEFLGAGAFGVAQTIQSVAGKSKVFKAPQLDERVQGQALDEIQNEPEKIKFFHDLYPGGNCPSIMKQLVSVSFVVETDDGNLAVLPGNLGPRYECDLFSLVEKKQLTPELIVRGGKNLLHGLAHIHGRNRPVAQQAVHGDLKLENCFFDGKTFRIADFGGVKLVGELTPENSGGGTSIAQSLKDQDTLEKLQVGRRI